MIIVKRKAEIIRFGLFLIIVGVLAYFVASRMEEALGVRKKPNLPELPASVPAAWAPDENANGSDFFADFRMGRQRRMGALQERLKEVMESESADSEARKQASQQYLETGRLAALEDRAEAMVKAKGFADVVVNLTGADAQVIVKTENLTQQQFLQVADMVSRITGVKAAAVQVWNRER